MITRYKYAGCISEIAEALKAGKQVKVIRKSDGEEIWICEYIYGAHYPYRGVDNKKNYWSIEKDDFEIVQEEKKKKTKLYIKSVEDICEWLRENKYKWEGYIFFKNKELTFNVKMFQFCGKRIKRKTFESGINRYLAYNWVWIPEWVEEVKK